MCRKTIEEQLGNSKKKELYILGSGWLLDVPIDFLSKKFEKIVLVDLNHPKQIEHLLNKYKNVELLTEDISGGALKQILKEKKKLSDYSPKWPFPKSGAAFISLNILNQLDNLIIENSSVKYQKNEIESFRKAIQQFHIDNLGEGSILITDYIEFDNYNGVESNIELIKCNMQGLKQIDTWIWGFDSLGNYRPRTSVKMEVRAFVKM